MKLRIYVDTSVIGGCEDEEWRVASSRLFQNCMQGSLVIVASDLTVNELEGAPEKVRQHMLALPPEWLEFVRLDEESRELAEAYISEGVISSKMRVDAQHIAVASVARVDVLVSWNFKHIVNLERIHGYNSVNLRKGYPLLEIRTPEEVLDYE